MERCLGISSASRRQGFIVPVSSISTDRYISLQSLLVKHNLHYSSYDDRPSRLFEGLEHVRLTIHLIGCPSSRPKTFSTRYHKWAAQERPTLFQSLAYVPANVSLFQGAMPKLTSGIETGILMKLRGDKKRLALFYAKGTGHVVYYSRKIGYFLQVLDFQPLVLDSFGTQRPPSEFKQISLSDATHAKAALCLLNANLTYWFITAFSDCRHVNKREVDSFPVDLDRLAKYDQGCRLMLLGEALMKDIQGSSVSRAMHFGSESLTVQCIYPKKSKPIIDELDEVLAKHYGLTDEELDFIVNYDIKYRMGKDAEGDG